MIHDTEVLLQSVVDSYKIGNDLRIGVNTIHVACRRILLVEMANDELD